MRQWVFIPGDMVSLNEIIEGHAQSRKVRRKKDGREVRISKFDERKAALTDKVKKAAAAAMTPIEPAFFTFFHVQPNRRTDPDNFAAGAHKVIFDGFQAAGLMSNDGWGEVLGFADYWFVGKRTGVLVCADTERTLLHGECVAEWEKRQ